MPAPPSPRPVSEGSRLGIVAPAGPFDRDAFAKGVEWLKTRYEIVHDPGIFSETGFFAGSDSRRLEELLTSLADPSIDAILCARGGYGATRLLPNIDVDAVREANKMIVGFSDITALHSIWAKAGVRSIHAPMVASLGNASETIRSHWISTIEDPGATRTFELQPFPGSDTTEVEGILRGGNLAVLGALNGTPFAPPLDDTILFFEDVGERPYRVDRMLTTLRQSGWFDRIRGIVIGAFTEGEPGPDGVHVDEVFADHFQDSAFPILTGLDAGHIRDNEPIPFGAPARIRGSALEVND